MATDRVPSSSARVPEVPKLPPPREASALSALLVPGGQLPNRQLGRPSITKIPSPYVEDNVSQERLSEEKVEKLLAKEDNHLSGSSLDERGVKLVEEENDFNWYFQHYNDTDALEPYVGIVYGNGPQQSSGASSIGVGLLIACCFFFVGF